MRYQVKVTYTESQVTESHRPQSSRQIKFLPRVSFLSVLLSGRESSNRGIDIIEGSAFVLYRGDWFKKRRGRVCGNGILSFLLRNSRDSLFSVLCSFIQGAPWIK